MGQRQFQTLLVGAAGKAGFLLVQRRLQLEQPGHLGPFQASFLAQAQFGVQGRAERRHQSLHHRAGREAVPVELRRAAQGRARVSHEQRRGHAAHPLAGGQPQGLFHCRAGDRRARRQHPFEQALAVAHGSVGQPPDQAQGVGVGLRAFLRGEARQLARDFFRGQAAKAVVLAAREDGRDDFFRLGGRQDEDDVAGRLLQRLEQRVEGGAAHHVRFVEDVDLLAAAHGRQGNFLAQVAHVVHAVVARRVDFQHVGVRPGPHREAAFALAAGFRRRPGAVGGHGNQAGGGRLAHPARPGKQVGVPHPPLLQRGPQHVLDVFLTHDIFPADRPRPLIDGAHGRLRPREDARNWC